MLLFATLILPLKIVYSPIASLQMPPKMFHERPSCRTEWLEGMQLRSYFLNKIEMAEESLWLFFKKPLRSKEIAKAIGALLERGVKVTLFLQPSLMDNNPLFDFLVGKGLKIMALDRSLDRIDHEFALVYGKDGLKLQIIAASFQPIRGVKRLVTEIEDPFQIHHFLEDFQRSAHPLFPSKSD